MSTNTTWHHICKHAVHAKGKSPQNKINTNMTSQYTDIGKNKAIISQIVEFHWIPLSWTCEFKCSLLPSLITVILLKTKSLLWYALFQTSETDNMKHMASLALCIHWSQQCSLLVICCIIDCLYDWHVDLDFVVLVHSTTSFNWFCVSDTVFVHVVSWMFLVFLILIISHKYCLHDWPGTWSTETQLNHRPCFGYVP